MKIFLGKDGLEIIDKGMKRSKSSIKLNEMELSTITKVP